MKAILFFVLVAAATMAAGAEEDRYYLFIGKPSPEGWRWAIANPSAGDREQVARSAVEKLGGKLLGYYWGVNNAKNYIIARLPADKELIPALLIMRLSSGLLTEYEAIELMPSQVLPQVLERITEISAVDDVQAGQTEKE